ncbi:MAG: signal recognition particle receptor subunit alpha, partial [Nitrososphaerota archaeon]
MTSLSEMLKKAISKFISSTTVDEGAINELVRGIQRSLLIGDVNVEIVQKISENVKKRAVEEKLPPGISRKDQVIKIVYEELVNLLGEETAKLNIPKDRR